MATRKKPSTRVPHQPFHVVLHTLREQNYRDPATLAGPAGLTIGQYMAMELGIVPVSRALYIEAVKIFKGLGVYPMPGTDPRRITPTTHPAVEREYDRMRPFHEQYCNINMGLRNKSAVGIMLVMALEGRITVEDVRRYFPIQ